MAPLDCATGAVAGAVVVQVLVREAAAGGGDHARAADIAVDHEGEVLESYVTDDKLYCVYDAEDPATIEEHARLGGFPCDSVSEVRSTISPATGR